MKKNEVYVTTNLDDKSLWTKQLRLADVHWLNGEPDFGKTYRVRTRHRAPLIKTKLVRGRTSHVELKLGDEVRAPAPGQSAVIYDGDLVLGGGVVI